MFLTNISWWFFAQQFELHYGAFIMSHPHFCVAALDFLTARFRMNSEDVALGAVGLTFLWVFPG